MRNNLLTRFISNYQSLLYISVRYSNRSCLESDLEFILKRISFINWCLCDGGQHAQSRRATRGLTKPSVVTLEAAPGLRYITSCWVFSAVFKKKYLLFPSAVHSWHTTLCDNIICALGYFTWINSLINTVKAYVCVLLTHSSQSVFIKQHLFILDFSHLQSGFPSGIVQHTKWINNAHDSIHGILFLIRLAKTTDEFKLVQFVVFLVSL